MNTKIGTEVAYVTCDLDTTFKVKKSKVNLQEAGAYCGGLPRSVYSMDITRWFWWAVYVVMGFSEVMKCLSTYTVVRKKITRNLLSPSDVGGTAWRWARVVSGIVKVKIKTLVVWAIRDSCNVWGSCSKMQLLQLRRRRRRCLNDNRNRKTSSECLVCRLSVARERSGNSIDCDPAAKTSRHLPLSEMLGCGNWSRPLC